MRFPMRIVTIAKQLGVDHSTFSRPVAEHVVLSGNKVTKAVRIIPQQLFFGNSGCGCCGCLSAEIRQTRGKTGAFERWEETVTHSSDV